MTLGNEISSVDKALAFIYGKGYRSKYLHNLFCAGIHDTRNISAPFALIA
jgi:hypothetical protein